MSEREIIGIVGQAGVGKTTVADLLANAGYKRVKMAAPLKAMLRALGLTDRELEGDLKHEPCRLLGGKTPRHAMQTLGTEWGRELIDPDLWLTAWSEEAVRVLAGTAAGAVCDDMRFANEADMIRRLGGTVVKVVGPRRSGMADAAYGHQSETQIESITPDVVIQNFGGPAELAREVERKLLT